MAVKLSFHGGVDEIGGNKVLLEDGDTRIWLDFGMSFGQFQTYFEEYMRPRTKTGIKDYLAMNLLPEIEGLYAPDLLPLAGRKEENPEYDAVLISHPHDDHVKYVSFIHPEIPVYMGKDCHGIRKILEEITTGTVDNRVVSYRERDPETGSAPRSNDTIKRNIIGFESGKNFTIGNVEVEPIHVDHSIPGAYGFILHTSEGPIVYTGDVRLHGRNGWKTKEFMNKAAEYKPAGVITEGTRIKDTEKEGESELNVRDAIMLNAKKTKGLVCVDYAFKDADRYKTLVEVAKQTGRKLVIGTKAAAVYDKYAKMGLDVPSTDDDNIMVHLKQKTTYKKYEKAYIGTGNLIEADDIGKKQDKFIFGLNQWTLSELIDVQPKNALYVRSMSEPYNEEMALSEERLNEWIDHFNMRKVRAHCSGHAPGSDLLDIVKTISAKTIYPIHTEHPKEFTKIEGKTKLVEEGKSYGV